MPRQDELYAWSESIQARFPDLSSPQATVLALWSFGIVLAGSCSLSAVTLMIAALLKKENTVRQRLREWYYDTEDKRGDQRQALVVEACFAPLLAWIIAWWRGERLALALDATNLKDRFVVLAVSVLYRGCAIPVAWTVLPANQEGAWRKDWLRMLRLLRHGVPSHMQVLVFADRGLYAPWLFRRICRLGWHPMLRVNTGGTFCPEDKARYYHFTTFVPQPGASWSGRGVAFKKPKRRLRCTLLAWWHPEAEEPWLILTDLAPDAADASWYRQRSWIERGFKMLKREGWQWHRTRMTDPERVARVWLVLTIATLRLLSLGTTVDLSSTEELIPDITNYLPVPVHKQHATQHRLVSLFRRGWVCFIISLVLHEPIPSGLLVPEPWSGILQPRDYLANSDRVLEPSASA
jgi:hypothetical protein